MKKIYIGMAWPSDGLNDSEYWKILPKNYELLISRYKVSGSLNPKVLKKEANLKKISEAIKALNLKKLNLIILCDFASSVLNDNYLSKSENYFQSKFKIPCINIVTSTIKFISTRKKNLSIISPYNSKITESFIKLLPKKNLIKSISYLSLKSEDEIDNTDKLTPSKFKDINNDILFIGGGVSINNFSNNYKKKFRYKIYSSPLVLIKDALKRLN